MENVPKMVARILEKLMKNVIQIWTAFPGLPDRHKVDPGPPRRRARGDRRRRRRVGFAGGAKRLGAV